MNQPQAFALAATLADQLATSAADPWEGRYAVSTGDVPGWWDVTDSGENWIRVELARAHGIDPNRPWFVIVRDLDECSLRVYTDPDTSVTL